jgi:hypothetical protein
MSCNDGFCVFWTTVTDYDVLDRIPQSPPGHGGELTWYSYQSDLSKEKNLSGDYSGLPGQWEICLEEICHQGDGLCVRLTLPVLNKMGLGAWQSFSSWVEVGMELRMMFQNKLSLSVPWLKGNSPGPSVVPPPKA